MRAALAVDASFSGALAMESAAVALGLAGRVPDREVLWVPPGRGVPKSFGDWHVVRLAVGDDAIAPVDGLPTWQVDPFGTSIGVNVPLRSRGTANSTSPTWVATVFGKVPLREFGNIAASGSPRS